MTTTIEGPARTIKVERLEVIKTGTRNNKPWTLYRVHASELDGTPISESLRTFDALEGVVTVTWEPYMKDGQVVNYTLKREGKRTTRPSGGQGSDDSSLEKRVAKLEAQMRAIIKNSDLEI